MVNNRNVIVRPAARPLVAPVLPYYSPWTFWAPSPWLWGWYGAAPLAPEVQRAWAIGWCVFLLILIVVSIVAAATAPASQTTTYYSYAYGFDDNLTTGT